MKYLGSFRDKDGKSYIVTVTNQELWDLRAIDLGFGDADRQFKPGDTIIDLSDPAAEIRKQTADSLRYAAERMEKECKPKQP